MFLAVVREQPSRAGLDELGAAPGMQSHDELAAVQHREALSAGLQQRRVVGAAGQLDVEAAAEAARQRPEDRGGVLGAGRRTGRSHGEQAAGSLRHGRRLHELERVVTAGGEGTRGACRTAIIARLLTDLRHVAAFAWLGILAQPSPLVRELIHGACDIGRERSDEIGEDVDDHALAQPGCLAADIGDRADRAVAVAEADRDVPRRIALAKRLAGVGLDRDTAAGGIGRRDVDRAGERHAHRAHTDLDLRLDGLRAVDGLHERRARTTRAC